MKLPSSVALVYPRAPNSAISCLHPGVAEPADDAAGAEYTVSPDQTKAVYERAESFSPVLVMVRVSANETYRDREFRKHKNDVQYEVSD